MTSNTTRVQGGFTACGNSYALAYTCAGPNCAVLNDFPNTTCTSSGPGLQGLSCRNAVTCPSGSGYTSTFNYTQQIGLVFQSQSVDLGACGNFIVSSDGTTGGTTSSVLNTGNANCNTTLTNSTSPGGTSSSTASSQLSSQSSESSSLPVSPSTSQTSVSSQSALTPTPPGNVTGIIPPFPTVTRSYGVKSARPPSMLGFFLCLVLGMFFLIQGAAALDQPDAPVLPARNAEAIFSPAEITELEAKSLDIMDKRLQERDGTSDAQIWAGVINLLGDYVGRKLGTLLGPSDPCKGTFAKNFIAEIENAVCTRPTGQIINARLGVDLIKACTSAILAGAVLTPPAELLATFTAGVSCNFMVSYLFLHTPAPSELPKFMDYVCNQPKPCGDLLSDPKNCGCCGNVCPTGICKNGACTSNTCTGKTCSTFGPCGPGGTCVCASTAEGTGFCVDGKTPCSSLATCKDSTNCGSGQICSVGTCCRVNVCVGATFCGGSSANPKYLFSRDYEGYGNATIADPGLPEFLV